MGEFYFHGITNSFGKEIVERIKALDLDPKTKNLYRDLLNASLELGGNVRWRQDNDAPTIAEIEKMQCSNIVILLLDKYDIFNEQRELAFDICQFGYSESHRLSSEKPEPYGAIMHALK